MTNRKRIDIHVCFCLAQRTHATSTRRRHDTNTRQHLTQSESSSSFASMSSFSFSSTANWAIDASSIFVFTMIQRFLEIRERAKAETIRSDVETRERKEIESRVEFETKKEKSSMTRRWSWFIIFSFRFWRRSCFLTSTSFRFSKSISMIDSSANVTTKSITEAVIWIEVEFVINIARSTKEEIKIVKRRIKTSRFISSNIEFVIDSSKDAETEESVTKNAKTNVTEEIDTIVTKNVKTNETKNAEIMSDFESTTKRKKIDFVSTFSKSRRDEREFTNALFLITFWKRSNSRLMISSLKEAEDFVFRERRELVMHDEINEMKIK